MYYKKYESERLYLSPICIDDYQKYTKWMNDETLASGLGNFYFYLSETSEKDWIESVNKKGSNDFAIIRKEDNKIIGNYGLEMDNDVSKRFHVGGYIGEITDRGKGYGTEALKLITKYAFEVLNAHTVFSGIYSFNISSLKAAIKAGYNEAGRYREAYFYNGVYNDTILVEITKNDYLASKNK